MIKIENVEVCGLEHAIRGMRNPMNSWDRSDSRYCNTEDDCEGCPGIKDKKTCDFGLFNRGYVLGPKDLYLGTKLSIGGPVHAKYRRMITVYMDITAPLYWWKEFDTYKVGTVSNSCSTMHKIHDKEFTLDDFSCEHLLFDGDYDNSGYIIDETIRALNYWRERYLVALKTEDETGLSAKDIWWQMIQLLPSSYNQRRTIMLNYEVLHNIYTSRRTHKLDEWREFCEFIVEELPYSVIFTCGVVECSKEV